MTAVIRLKFYNFHTFKVKFLWNTNWKDLNFNNFSLRAEAECTRFVRKCNLHFGVAPHFFLSDCGLEPF